MNYFKKANVFGTLFILRGTYCVKAKNSFTRCPSVIRPECNDKPVPITTYLNRGVLAPDLLSATAKPQPQESASSSLAFCTVPFICLELDGGVSILLAAVEFQQFCRAGPSPSKQPPERSLKGVL